MDTFTSEVNNNIMIRSPSNFPIMIDQQFDLDEVLTFAEMPTQYDHHGDHDRSVSSVVAETELRNPDSVVEFVTVAGLDSCAVCMDSFRSGESGERIPCGHVYHSSCISAWLSVCNSCPLCRCRVSGDDQFSRGGKH